MALIATQNPSDGALITFEPAAASDTCEVSAGPQVTHHLFLMYDGVGSPTVTLATPGTDAFGAAIPDRVFTLTPGLNRVKLYASYRNLATNTVALTYSATTDIDVAVVQMG